MGLPKTGTTATQAALFTARERLLTEYSLYYPKIGENHTDALCTMFLDDPLKHISVRVAGISDAAGAEALRSDYRIKMEAELASSDWQTLMLSAEGLSNLPAESLRNLRSWLSHFVEEFRVLFVTRDPVAFATSTMQEMLKGGYTLEQMYRDPPVANFKGRLGNAISAFGRDSIEVHSFEEAIKFPGGIVAFFADVLGLTRKFGIELAQATQFKNTSMSLEAALILSSLNRQRPLFINGKLNPLRRLEDRGTIMRIKGSRFELPVAVQRCVRLLARDDVAWLNSKFQLDLYSDLAGASDNRSDSKHYLSHDTIDSIALLASDLVRRAK